VAGTSSASIARIEPPVRVLEVVHLPHAGDDRIALGLRARGDADVAQHVVVHGRLVSRHMRDAAGADDEQVLLHVSFLGVQCSVFSVHFREEATACPVNAGNLPETLNTET